MPSATTVVRVGGSLYLLYLAVRLASSKSLTGTDAAEPLNAVEALVFQFVNPKAWLFATTVATAGLPERSPTPLEAVLIVTTAMAVATCSFAVWAAGSAALRRVVTSERALRRLNLAIAIGLVASIAFLWL
jgi:threonine/homoserine/homoserine lactone efflux protein